MLDGGVGAHFLGLVFREEFAHNAAAEERGVVDALALGSGGVRAGRSLGSFLGRGLGSGCLGFDIGEGGQNQEDDDSVDDGEDDTID